MKSLTREEVLTIPTLREQGLTAKQIAERLGVKRGTINAWVLRLRRAGYTVPAVKNAGRKKVL